MAHRNGQDRHKEWRRSPLRPTRCLEVVLHSYARDRLQAPIFFFAFAFSLTDLDPHPRGADEENIPDGPTCCFWSRTRHAARTILYARLSLSSGKQSRVLHARLCISSISKSVAPVYYARVLIWMDHVERCSFRSDCNSLLNAEEPAKHAPDATRQNANGIFRKRRQKRACQIGIRWIIGLIRQSR